MEEEGAALGQAVCNSSAFKGSEKVGNVGLAVVVPGVSFKIQHLPQCLDNHPFSCCCLGPHLVSNISSYTLL